MKPQWGFVLLKRVDTLQLEHYNKGTIYIPFPFKNRDEKDRLYSVVSEYAETLENK